jgi:non-specific serine/threonine protein kinase
MAPEVLATRLDDPLAALDAGYRDHPPRHRSLAANLDWSFQLCSPAEQALWCRLAVFPGGFDVAAAETVCVGEGVGAHEILSLVSALASQSIIAQDATTPGRYRMPEPVRQFGKRHLTAGDELTHWQDAHLAWVSSLGHDLATHWIGSDELAWMRRIRLEQANIRAAFEYAVATPRHATAALQLCTDLEPYWLCDGLLNEGRLWVDRALAVAPGSGDAEIHASVMAPRSSSTRRSASATATRVRCTSARTSTGRSGSTCCPRARSMPHSSRCVPHWQEPGSCATTSWWR